MIYECPACAAELQLHHETGNWICFNCRNIYDPSGFSDIERPAKETKIPSSDNLQNNASDQELSLLMKVCSCPACAAELAVNDTESASYCLYCGQPVIVFDRVISMRKPKYIIPFSITKEEALARIRKSLRFRFVIPRKIIHFEIEKLQGIYIPYWLFDTKCQGDITFKSDDCSPFIRTANLSLHNLTVDASFQLHNELSKRLEPYDLSKLEPFNPAYFSGFYADCYDAPLTHLKDLARSRSEEITNEKLTRSLREHFNNIQVHHSDLTCNITDSKYAMLPAWFLSFRYKKESYQILVNGQTGKIVGDFPISKGFIVTVGILVGVPSTLIIFSSLMDYFTLAYLGFPPLLIPGVLGYLFIAMFAFKRARKIFNKVKNRIKIAKDIKTNIYIKDRTEEY